MATVLHPEDRPANLTAKICAYFFILSLLFGCCIVAVHFFYERHYKKEALNHTLEQSALWIDHYLRQAPFSSLDSLTGISGQTNMRVTIVDLKGNVLYDNYLSANELDNHLFRPEIVQASKQGVGSDIRRSTNAQISYYYFAKRFDRYYIRTALPYQTQARRILAPSYLFLCFTGALLLLLAAGMFMVWKRLGRQLAGKQQEEERHIRQELTQNLSHELKTPVSSILGYMETLTLNPKLEPEKMRFFIERSYIQTQRLSQLIEDISLLTRLDYAPDKFPFEQIDLYEVIQNVIQDISLQLSDHSISVTLPPPQTLMVQGNPSLLYSIFRNLFDNTMAHAGKGVTISILWQEKIDQYIHFTFSDNGPGVSPEHLPHLFDRFYRIDRGRSRKQGGTGLGLAIVKNGVLTHGGSIEAKTNEGKGLTFSFKIKTAPISPAYAAKENIQGS